MAGPRRPQDRVALADLRDDFLATYPPAAAPSGTRSPARRRPRPSRTGSVAIAAITSCTNTSNPTVMVGAGLLARNAVARGLTSRPRSRPASPPGPRRSPSTSSLRADGAPRRLGFGLVGYGCTTCIGNCGPLDEPVAQAVEDDELVVAAVLSGNRNFEGRIHPLVRASYLASPPLVVAFALAGRVDIDLTTEPLGMRSDGRPVMLADIWPTPAQVREVIADSIDPELFRRTYASVFEGDERWAALPDPLGRPLRLGRGVDLHRPAAVLRGPRRGARAARRHRGRARPRASRRLGDHRPHHPRRVDRRLVARRASGSRPTASGRSTSTRTVRAAATTR